MSAKIQPATHPHDPETYEPLDSELTDDDDMDDAEREARLRDEAEGEIAAIEELSRCAS